MSVEDCWRDLALAVVIKAAQEYKSLLTCKVNNPYDSKRIKDLEKFFRSEWCRWLGVDGIWVMEKIKGEINGG